MANGNSLFIIETDLFCKGKSQRLNLQLLWQIYAAIRYFLPLESRTPKCRWALYTSICGFEVTISERKRQ